MKYMHSIVSTWRTLISHNKRGLILSEQLPGNPLTKLRPAVQHSMDSVLNACAIIFYHTITGLAAILNKFSVFLFSGHK
jgi:hypothetical protein